MRLENTTYNAEVEHGINCSLTQILQHFAGIAVGVGLGQLVVAQINLGGTPELHTHVEVEGEAMLGGNGTAEAYAQIRTEGGNLECSVYVTTLVGGKQVVAQVKTNLLAVGERGVESVDIHQHAVLGIL